MPSRLSNYADLMAALTSGRLVRVVVAYGKCRMLVGEAESPGPDATGGMTLSVWEQFGRGVVRNERSYLSASETVLIAHPRYGYVLNYVKLRVYEDGAVEITARYLKPATYEVVMNETFLGRLSDGQDGNGVSCFASG